MNYTSNYHLPQWEKSDRIMMDDFNQAMGNIETGINIAMRHGTDTGNTAAAAAAKAQTTANSALSAANAAQTSADKAFRPGYLPYKAGTYSGKSGGLDVYVGFKPSFVIITHQIRSASDGSGEDFRIAAAGPNGSMNGAITMTSSGFTIGPVYVPDSLSSSGTTYSYIAFR